MKWKSLKFPAEEVATELKEEEAAEEVKAEEVEPEEAPALPETREMGIFK